MYASSVFLLSEGTTLPQVRSVGSITCRPSPERKSSQTKRCLQTLLSIGANIHNEMELRGKENKKVQVRPDLTFICGVSKLRYIIFFERKKSKIELRHGTTG